MSGLDGKWLIELGELGSVRGAKSVETMKAFVSSAVDHYRPAYARFHIECPRQCVFVGTTNESVYLADQTGNRRFWPVACGKIDLIALEADREQLFAEAMSAFSAGESWWLDSTTAILASDETEQRTEEDPWEEQIVAWLKHADVRKGVTMCEVLQNALHVDAERQTKAQGMRAAVILKAYGWLPSGKARPRRYKPTP
jgi:putative DNA primase/helicase